MFMLEADFFNVGKFFISGIERTNGDVNIEFTPRTKKLIIISPTFENIIRKFIEKINNNPMYISNRVSYSIGMTIVSLFGQFILEELASRDFIINTYNGRTIYFKQVFSNICVSALVKAKKRTVASRCIVKI